MKSSLNNPVEIPSRKKGTGSVGGGGFVEINDADDCIISVNVPSAPMIVNLTNNRILTDSIIILSVNNLGGAKLIANLRNDPGEGIVQLVLDSDNDSMGGAFSGGDYKINVSIF